MWFMSFLQVWIGWFSYWFCSLCVQVFSIVESILHAYEFVFTLHKYYFHLFPVTTNESKYEGLEFHMGMIVRNIFLVLHVIHGEYKVCFSQTNELPAKQIFNPFWINPKQTHENNFIKSETTRVILTCFHGARILKKIIWQRFMAWIYF